MKNKPFRLRSRQAGFTLVELLIVIAIIGILSTVAVVNLNIARHKAKVAALQQQMASVIPAIILCFDAGHNIMDGAGDFCDIVNSGAWEPGATMCTSPAANWPKIDYSEIDTGECYSDKDKLEFSFEATIAGTSVTCTQDGCYTTP